MSETPFFTVCNAAEELLARNRDRGGEIAVIDRDGAHRYADVEAGANRFANLLRARNVQPEQRVLLVLDDSVAFHHCFLGAMLAGCVPVPLNTLFTADDYAFIVEDSRAAAIVASPGHVARLPQDLEVPTFTTDAAAAGGFEPLGEATADCAATATPFPSRADDAAFWLYTSGTTGKPKAAIHAQSDIAATARHYAGDVLGMTADDVVFSAAKLFFAYGLGNSLSFPMYHGATAVLHDGPPTAPLVKALLDAHTPTLFFGVPTLYAMLLNGDSTPAPGHRLRLCVSAGEALPEAILERWRGATGAEILDGIGSTEMLHIYMSNRAGRVHPGSSGTAVDGYAVKILTEDGAPAPAGEIGDLYVRGPSMALGYWNRRELSQATFQGAWMRTGDKYRETEDGSYVYCGRSDDLLKVGGIYVSPMEVENALLEHPNVAEAAVVGARDDDDLVKPKAFVVLQDAAPDAAMSAALIEHVRGRLAAYKRPRWVEFMDALPKTATGKIQRFRLR